MNNDIEAELARLLGTVAPREAPRELRSAVLTAVEAALGRRRPNWTSRIGRAVAAAFLFSVAMNFYVGVSEERRMAAWDRRPVVRSDVAELAAAVTAAEMGQKLQEYLLAQTARSPDAAATAMCAEIDEIQRCTNEGRAAERTISNAKHEDRI